MPWAQNNGAAVSSFSSDSKVEGTVVPVVNKAKNETDLPGMIEGAKDVVVGVICNKALIHNATDRSRTTSRFRVRCDL